jgi:hypothetical protein
LTPIPVSALATPFGSISGGHAAAQMLKQVEVPDWLSGSKM